jgi:hypothetical protein
MPISPDDAEDLAAELTQMHVEAERGLLGRLVSAFTGDSAPNVFRRNVVSFVLGFRDRTRKAAKKAADEAVKRGSEAADEDLGDKARSLPSARTEATTKQLDTVHKKLDAVHDAMAAQTANQYQRVIKEVSIQVDAGTSTRLQAAQSALNKFANSGITGFVDKRGRNWELASYVEMAVRTETATLMTDSHVERLQQAGVNLVIVSNAPYECPLCKPWEGKILTTKGPEGKHTVTVGGVTVQVAGSLDEAKSKGLFHPNCRHSVSAYQPGFTTPAVKPDTKGVTYKDVEKQRYLERQARMWDRRRSVAVDDKAKALAEAKFKAYRDRIKQHVAETGLKRKSNRELDDKAR